MGSPHASHQPWTSIVIFHDCLSRFTFAIVLVSYRYLKIIFYFLSFYLCVIWWY
ncbi:hypothetical protein ACOSP7_033087 [Xanthoceras sorbifolium]